MAERESFSGARGSYDVTLFTKDPVSILTGVRRIRVAAANAGWAKRRAKRQFERNCAPIRVIGYGEVRRVA